MGCGCPLPGAAAGAGSRVGPALRYSRHRHPWTIFLTSRMLRFIRVLSRAWCPGRGPRLGPEGRPYLQPGAPGVGWRGELGSGFDRGQQLRAGLSRRFRCHRRALALPDSPGCSGAPLPLAGLHLPACYGRRGPAAGGFGSHKATRAASSLPAPRSPITRTLRRRRARLGDWVRGAAHTRRHCTFLPAPRFYRTRCFFKPTSCPPAPCCNALPSLEPGTGAGRVALGEVTGEVRKYCISQPRRQQVRKVLHERTEDDPWDLSPRP